MRKKAIVLLSGGLDSTTTLAYAIKKDGMDVFPLSFYYGQKHSFELNQVEKILNYFEIPLERWKLVNLDKSLFETSALVNKEIEVPRDRDFSKEEIPSTYVPARNTIFLSYAIAYGEIIGTGEIYIGVNAIDYSGYPDCRPEYIEAFEKMANLATKASVEGKINYTIHTPLIKLTKSEIIKLGLSLGVDYSITHSCYSPGPNGEPCGECDSCRLRIKGFEEAGEVDPLAERYLSKKYFPDWWPK